MRICKTTFSFGSLMSMVAIMVVATIGQTAHAQWAYNQEQLQRMTTASNPFQGNAVTLEYEAAGFGTQHAGAFMLNQYVGVASAHEFQLNGFTLSGFRVLNGSNYITNRGEERNVAQFQTHPTWTGNFNWTTGRDMAWFILDQPLLTAQTIQIAPAVMGENLTAVGTGFIGVAGGSLGNPDAERRAFETFVDFFGTPGVTSSDYITSIFAPPEIRYIDLGGSATVGFSGSGMLNSSNQLVSVIVGGSTVGGFGSATYSARLDGLQGWIPTVPAPGSAALLGLGTLYASRRRRQ